MPGTLVIGLIFLAIAADWLLMRGLKKYFQIRNAQNHSRTKPRTIFGQYSPLLTWIGSLWPNAKNSSPEPVSPAILPDLPDVAAAEKPSRTERLGTQLSALLWFYLASLLCLAALPPLLVVQDRWLGNSKAVTYIDTMACLYKVFCNYSYPGYFAIIFLALLVFLLVYLRFGDPFQVNLGAGPSLVALNSTGVAPPTPRNSRRKWDFVLLGLGGLGFLVIVLRSLWVKTPPGVELALAIGILLLGLFLREMDGHSLADQWAKQRGWLVPFGLLQIALILFLNEFYSSLHFHWIYGILLLLASLYLLRRYKEVPAIGWIFTLALVLYLININAWWLSAIGDEYEFYIWARAIAQEFSLSHTASFLFSRNGAYGTHTYLSSILQAIPMIFLGATSFGWRFSSLFLSALSLLFFYSFFKTFVSRKLALTASMFLAISHYIMSFGKIGYNNLQALFALSLVLWASARALRTRSPFSYALLGLTIGFCFYVYPAALYAIPIPILLLLFYAPPVDRQMTKRWAVMAAFALLLIYPLFLQPEYWQTKIAGTFLYSSQLTHSLPDLLKHFFTNYVFAFFSYLYTPEEGHFIAVSYADPLTGVFISIGMVLLLRLAIRDRFFLFWWLSFLSMVFLAGASHDRQFPPSTRMFLLLPWFALFAASGLWWLLEQVRHIRGYPLSNRIAPVIMFAIILGLSLYQAYPLALNRMTGFQSPETLFFRLLQRAQVVYPGAPKTYVFITDPSWTSQALHKLPEYYPVQANFAEVVVDMPHLPDTARPLLTQSDSFVIIKPWMEETWKKPLEGELLGLGKTPCDINATDGQPRFQLWHSPGMDGLCQ